MRFPFRRPPKPTDVPDVSIIIRNLSIDCLPDRVRCTVTFTPLQGGLVCADEGRTKDFDLNTPFVDILEAVPDVFIDWKPVLPARRTQ